MSSDTTAAIVLKASDFSETSKIVTLYTRDLGKLRALAKGGRRLKARFEVGLDLLSVLSISVIRKSGSELDLLTEAMLLERFAGLRGRLAGLHAGYYIAEVLDKLTQTDDPHPALYDWLLEGLRRLDAGASSTITLLRFVMGTLRELGYGLSLSACVHCGEELPASPTVALSLAGGGVVCPRCLPEVHGTMPTRAEVVRWLQVDDGDAEAHATESAKEAWRIAAAAVRQQLGRRPVTEPMVILD